jgi:hypothetical protein
MADGGGFCDKHGPFDPPHRTCPYCAIERERQRAYSPPAEPDSAPAARNAPPTGFVRQTVEPPPPDVKPEPRPGVTEIVPRRSLDPEPPAEDEAPPAPPDLLGWLIVKEPAAQRGVALTVRANQIIGREGDVRWDDPRLSRQHARLTVEPSAEFPDDPPVFHLWPFGTTNPVFVNGQEIRGATPLHENDQVRLGDTLFVFKVLTD